MAYTEASTGDSILDPKKEIIRYASIGKKGKYEERLFFETDEVLKIKNLGMSPCKPVEPSAVVSTDDFNAALKLLGFLPRKDMKEQYTCKHSYLIYPNETVRCPLPLHPPADSLRRAMQTAYRPSLHF